MFKSKRVYYFVLHVLVVVVFCAKKCACQSTSLNKLPLRYESRLNRNDLVKKQHVNVPIFQPKQTEPPNDDDYTQFYDDEYYDSDYTYESLDPQKNPDVKTSTSAAKWSSTKNSTAPSEPNLKYIFDFVEFLLRPTNPNENTVESVTSSRGKVPDENETMQNLDYYFPDYIDQMPNEKRFSLKIV